MDAHKEWLDSLETYSVEDLFTELDHEMQALKNIESDDYYDDQVRQISVTRGNIERIRQIIAKKANR